MLGKRRLQHESLESRRLLAATCQPADVPAETGDALQVLESVSTAEAEVVRSGEIAGEIAFPPDVYNLSYGPDLIQQQGNKLFVVDQQPYAFEGGKLHIFERTAAGAFENLAEVEVGFPVERMIVHGDQVLLFGNNLNWIILAEPGADGAPSFSTTAGDDFAPPVVPKTATVTINLGAEVEVIRQEFEGLYHDIHHQGDRIVMVSSVGSDATIAIYPPPLMAGLVRTFDITPDGLHQVSSGEIPLFGITQVNERDFYVAATSHPDIVFLTPGVDSEIEGGGNLDPNGDGIRAPDHPILPTVSVSRYFLGDDAIGEVESLELGAGFLSNFEVSSSGQTAVVVRSEFNGAGPSTSVDLLNLSGEEIQVETIQLPQFHGQAIVVGPDYVVLRSYADNTLVIIDANQDIDPAAENRVRRIEFPAALHLHYDYLHVSEDRLVVRAERSVNIREDGEPDANGEVVENGRTETILLTISISEARIIADTHLPEGVRAFASQQFFLIDAETERFGFLIEGATAVSVRPQFLFGRLGETGEFERQGTIPVGRWLEIDANADRLIARESDRLLEYDWEHTEQPIVTPLGDPEPAIEAVNDQYTLHAGAEDHVLDVLANDVIHHRGDVWDAEIVELIGAPEGAEIVGGRLVRIPASALTNIESLRFEYVISDGEHRSSAVVEIEVKAIREEQVRELVAAVRRRAAEDFNVSVDEVVITSVERIFGEPLPVVLPNEPNELDLSPGILVTLTVPNATALYAASLEGRIIQVFASQREYLVELGLRAVNTEGETLEQVSEGDQFWLELNAKDLREFGLGVYAAFFDLIVPTEHLVITGPVEYGPGFASIPGSEFDEGEIDELGAIGTEIESPGNARQQILRIGVRAVGAGEVTLRPGSADDRGTETLLRGRETEVPVERVRYSSLTLNIIESTTGDPLDADGNGALTATDALVVINFLGRYGATTLEELADKVLRIGGEGEAPTDADFEAMRRFDTNRSGTITALDALNVINGLGRQTLAREMAAGEQVGFAVDTLSDDDDEERAVSSELF